MTVSNDPAVRVDENIAAVSVALARWYDAHPSVRRLVGIAGGEGLRVLLVIEPALDDDDILPVWLANTRSWTMELCVQTGRSVRLEPIQDPPGDRIDVDPGSSLIADLFWRDATLGEPNERMQPPTTAGVLDSAARESASRVPRAVCKREIPLSAAASREASDYVEYFCGLDFSEWWHSQSPSPE